MREEGGWARGEKKRETRNVFNNQIEEEVLPCRWMEEKKCIRSEGSEVETSNSTSQSPSYVIFSFFHMARRQLPLSRPAIFKVGPILPVQRFYQTVDQKQHSQYVCALDYK